jgi:hypothetical protein
MLGIRLIMLGLAALVASIAVGAFASAAASAHRFVDCLKVAAGSKGTYEESKCEKAKTGGEWEKYEVAGTGSGTGGITKLKTELFKAEVIISCKKATFKVELEKEGASQGEVDFEECSIGNSKETFTSCAVPDIKFKLRGQLFAEGEEINIEFKPFTGEIFVEIVIQNKAEKTCIEKGHYPVAGTQACRFPEGRQFEVTHRIECVPSGSHMTFAGNPATFEGSRSIGTSANDSWAVE